MFGVVMYLCVMLFDQGVGVVQEWVSLDVFGFDLGFLVEY